MISNEKKETIDMYDIFISDLKGNIVRQITTEKGYDAEATVSPLGDKIVFTSIRSGDLELYTCNIYGSNVIQVTNQLGYDGGAFFSNDGKKLVFRSSRPKTPKEIKEYKDLLSQGLVQPTKMEIYTCNIDGSNLKQITDLGKANWSPFFHPSDQKIIFCSNHATKIGFPFNLYMIDVNGENLEQISFDKTFDSFPVFSNDGTKIVFSSNRKILTQLNLLWGVKAFYYNNFKSTDKTVEEINEIALNMGYIQKKDLMINLTSMPVKNKGMVNTLRVSVIK